MKLEWIGIIGFCLIAGAMLFRMFAGASQRTTPEEAKRLVLEENALLIDVRSAGEYAGGHIKGAENISVGNLHPNHKLLKGEEKGRAIVVYCASGMRSASAASALRSHGFSNVHDLGGMSRWPN